MLGEGTFSDLLLVGGEGEGVAVHRAVLAAASPLLRSLFLDTPTTDTFLCLVGVGREELEALVMFVYWGEVEVARGRLEALLEVAEGLQVRGLCRQQRGQTEVEEQKDQAEQKEQEVVVHHLLVEGGGVTRKELQHVAAPVSWRQFLESEQIMEEEVEVEETKGVSEMESAPLEDTVEDAKVDMSLLETEDTPAELISAPCSVQEVRRSRRGVRVKVEEVEARWRRLRKEMEEVRARGEMCVVLGDMNKLVGADEWGVEGNHSEVSPGGRLLRELLAQQEWSLVNSMGEVVVGGPWTRVDPATALCRSRRRERKRSLNCVFKE